MLLNVAAEQPDHELLLQKHFTALLSSVWRVKSRVENQQNMPSSRNAHYNSGRVFNSSVNPLPWNSLRESAKRMKFTNLGQSTKLLAAALHDASSRRPGDRVSNSNVNEEAPAVGEKLEITLEFQKEENDYLIPFPPVISLSIPGSAPWMSVNKDRAAAHHLRASTSVAENRFRYVFLQSRRLHGSACVVWIVSLYFLFDDIEDTGVSSAVLLDIEFKVSLLQCIQFVTFLYWNWVDRLTCAAFVFFPSGSYSAWPVS
jgi:hypothetical protein